MSDLSANGFWLRRRGEHPGFAAACAQLGRTLHQTNVCVAPGSRSLVCSRRALGPHTDHFRADFVVWECITSAAYGGDTFLVDPWPAFHALSESDRTAIRLVRVREHRLFYDDPDDRSVVTAVGAEQRIYFTYWLAHAATAAQTEAVQRYRSMLSASPSVLRAQLQPGDLLIVDNRRLLHGRSSFTGPRHLIRTWVSEDPDWNPQWIPTAEGNT